MDPTANLEGQIRLSRRIRDCEDADHEPGGTCTCYVDGHRLAGLVLELDHWIVSGGFPPDAWKGAQR